MMAGGAGGGPDPQRPECREEQLALLSLLLGTAGPLPQALLLHGMPDSGKTTVLAWLLRSTGTPHAFVDCVEVFQHRLLFQSAAEQVAAGLGQTARRCDTASDLVTELQRLLGPTGGRAVLVLEQAERLREEGSLLGVFTRLQELSGLPGLCCVLETRLDWARLRPAEDLATPLAVTFPQYTREELARLVGVLLLTEPEARDFGPEFRRAYGGIVLSVFYNVTRSLGELLHIARLNYAAYTRPVLDGEVEPTQSKKLWFNIEPSLKACLSTVHLREVASRQLTDSWREAEKENEADQVKVAAGPGPTIANVSRITIELPFYSKFLLIAAFLASYNPAKSDKRFFQKHHGKQRKTSSSIRAKERMNSQLTGPKTFPLERLLAIFYNIVDEKVNPTASIYSQLSSLTSLQLLSAMGADMMDQPKYKCNVSLDFVRTVAKPLQFDVYKYLYDHC